MPPRVDTWFFSVHNFVKRHNLRHWLTVAEARKLLKGEKLGIDAANNCFSRPRTVVEAIVGVSGAPPSALRKLGRRTPPQLLAPGDRVRAKTKKNKGV